MVGIVSYGAYVPVHRLGPGTRGWAAPTEKAVASWDEDSLTMAVEAALDAIGKSDRNKIDGAYYASTTSPYREKLVATTLAMATGGLVLIRRVACPGVLLAILERPIRSPAAMSCLLSVTTNLTLTIQKAIGS